MRQLLLFSIVEKRMFANVCQKISCLAVLRRIKIKNEKQIVKKNYPNASALSLSLSLSLLSLSSLLSLLSLVPSPLTPSHSLTLPLRHSLSLRRTLSVPVSYTGGRSGRTIHYGCTV